MRLALCDFSQTLTGLFKSVSQRREETIEMRAERQLKPFLLWTISQLRVHVNPGTSSSQGAALPAASCSLGGDDVRRDVHTSSASPSQQKQGGFASSNGPWIRAAPQFVNPSLCLDCLQGGSARFSTAPEPSLATSPDVQGMLTMSRVWERMLRCKEKGVFLHRMDFWNLLVVIRQLPESKDSFLILVDDDAFE